MAARSGNSADASNGGASGVAQGGDSDSTQGTDSRPDTWIEVELFDAAGEPVVNADYKIRSADGGVRQGTLNGSGSVHVEPLVHGTCQVSFPRLDRREPGPLPPDAPPEQDLDAIAFTRRRVDAHEVETGASHRFQLRRLHASVIEAEHFHDDSSVFLPCRDPQRTEVAETDITGIDVLRAAFLFQRDNPEMRALVTGHGTGQTARSDGFSLLRARSLYYLLIGNGPAWSQQSAQNQTLRDVQSILRWANELWAWECDPGPADGVLSETTRKAFDAFRSGYGEEFAQPMPCAMDESGRVGEDTFAIFFDLYQRALAVSLEIEREALREWQTKWLWVSGAKPAPPTPAEPKRAWLHIRRTDSIWPVKMAEIAVHDARRYTELNPLNPQHVRPDGGGWKDLYAGDDIYIPPNWAQALRDAGYEIHEEGADPGPVEPPLDDAIGCGEHHLVTPYRETVGRAAVRLGEVLFFGEEEIPRRVCRDQAACDAGSCEVYDPREYERIYIDVSHQALAIPSWIAISLHDGDGKPVGGERYILTLTNGQTIEDRLPNNGRAYCGPIPRGLCELEFPDLSQDCVVPRFPPGPSPYPPPKPVPPAPTPSSGRGQLLIVISDDQGSPVPNAEVSLAGPSARKGISTFPRGHVQFSELVPGDYQVTASCEGFFPTGSTIQISASLDIEGGLQQDSRSEGDDSATPEASGANRLDLSLPRRSQINRIRAFAPITPTITNKPIKTGDNTGINGERFQELKFSKSQEEDISKNPPVVLVSGMLNLLLEAETTPEGREVTWDLLVHPEGQSSGIPKLSPIASVNNNKALLEAKFSGLFSIIAKTETGSKKVWNVVFVDVSLVGTGSARGSEGTDYEGDMRPLGLSDLGVLVKSGNQPNGKHGWQAEATVAINRIVPTVASDKIKIHMLQNQVADTVVAVYQADKEFSNEYKSYQTLQKFPAVDTEETIGTVLPEKHFPTGSNTVLVEMIGADRWKLSLFDTPATAAFGPRHKNHPEAKIRSIVGSMRFVTAIAAVSTDAPHSVVVCANVEWAMNVNGTVNFKQVHYDPDVSVEVPVWTSQFGTGTSTQIAFTSVVGDRDAATLGFEIWQPNVLNQIIIKHDA